MTNSQQTADNRKHIAATMFFWKLLQDLNQVLRGKIKNQGIITLERIEEGCNIHWPEIANGKRLDVFHVSNN
jgi:hypothetical protein